MSVVLREPFTDLDTISLAELQAEAAFLTRQDRKYLLPVEYAEEFFAGLDREARVLEIEGDRRFEYLTPYFDDAHSSAYLRAARRRPNRFKVRTRLYLESGLCMLEVKVRDSRGLTVKHRIDHDALHLTHLAGNEQEWLAQFPQVAPYAGELRHCITTRYRRTTLVLPHGAGRATIDSDLRFIRPDGAEETIPNHLIVETKGPGKPTSIDRVLWRHGIRPTSISKFTTGLGLLMPSLPSNRWHRVLERLREL
jgi:hypothetical protein